MPVTKAGSWFLNFEKQMDPELVEVVEGLVFQIWKVKQAAAKYPERQAYYAKKINELQSTINELRRHLALYKEYSSLENLAILGEQFF